MNTGVILGMIILAILIGISVYYFIKLDKEQKIANVKEWLKYAVVMAEKSLGGGTGQLKLRYVYNAAVAKFPWLVSLVSFEMFSGWVDEALEWMKQQLESNAKINDFVTPKE